jgi:hypothetical protein
VCDIQHIRLTGAVTDVQSRWNFGDKLWLGLRKELHMANMEATGGDVSDTLLRRRVANDLRIAFDCELELNNPDTTLERGRQVEYTLYKITGDLLNVQGTNDLVVAEVRAQLEAERAAVELSQAS